MRQPRDERLPGYLNPSAYQLFRLAPPLLEKPIIVPAQGIVHRRSTDTLAINDEKFVRAIRYLRENACSPNISVTDIANHAGLHRRTLEQRFRTYLHRSPLEEIQRIRLEKAREMLRKNHSNVEEIANLVGYQSYTYFYKIFQKYYKTMPNEYRKVFYLEPN